MAQTVSQPAVYVNGLGTVGQLNVVKPRLFIRHLTDVIV